MRSSKLWRAAAFLLICACITAALDYMLIPPNTVWLNLHNLRNGETYDTVYIGTSHGQYGIDPASIDAVTGGSSVSLCMADVYPKDMYYILKLACETQAPSRVVYELDPSYWMNEQRSGSTQIFFYQEFPLSVAKAEYFMDKIMDLDFRSTLAPWSYYRNLYGQIPDHVRRKQGEAYKNHDPSVLEIPAGHYGGRGFVYRDHIDGEDKGTYNNIPWNEALVKEEAPEYFDRIAKLCRDKGMELIVITTPVPKETFNQFRESYVQSDAYFTRLMERYGLEYHDFNYMKPELLDCSMAGYWDYDGHMDGEMAGRFGTVLGRFLSGLEDGTYQASEYFTQ